MLRRWKEYLIIKESGLFDPAFYLLNNPDVRKADIDPLMHFIKYGWKEGRNPSLHFSTNYYLVSCPDVKKANINPLVHYIKHGIFEGRITNEGELNSIRGKSKHIIFHFIMQLNFRRLFQLIKKAMGIWQIEGFLALVHRVKKQFINLGSLEINLGNISVFNDIEFNYQEWIEANEPSQDELIRQKERARQFKLHPLISILVPIFNTPIDILELTIQSVLNQTYENWELCLVDASSSNREEIKNKINDYLQRDNRIKCKFLSNNLGISANTNVALSMANGEFIHLLDHDDALPPNALFEIIDYMNQDPQCDLIYSDEDKITMAGVRKDPFFKPDWSPDMLQAGMYIGHSTYRTKLVKELGGFRPEFDFSQDYDLALRITEKTNRIGHISKVLYHWRELPGSAATGGKTYARESNISALSDAMKRRGYNGKAIALPPCNQYLFENIEQPLISIIIPSDNLENINKSISSIVNNSDYPNYEIIIVTNSEICRAFSEKKRGKTIQTVSYDGEYNFSKKCNIGVENARGEFVLFLNDDVYPLEKNWIDILLGPFQQPEVGAVSPKLVYSDGTIQHAGLVTGVRNLIGTAFHTWAQDSRYYFNLPQMTRTVSALSAACLLMRREVFERINGFDTVNTPIAHSDLDLCFKIRELGLRLVYTPHTQLQHVGHLSIKEIESKGIKHSEKADIYLLKKWSKYVNYDPYYPTNMRDRLYFDSPMKYRMWVENSQTCINNSPDILVQTHDLSLSGSPLFAFDLVSYLNNRGYFTVTVAGTSGKLLSSFQNKQLPIILDPLVMESPEALDHFTSNFDLIIANTIFGWKLVRSASRLKIPVIWFIHEGVAGITMAQQNNEIQKAFSEAGAVVFPSNQTLKKYEKFKTRNNFISVIFGTYSLGKKVTSKEENGKVKIVHVGSIEKRKGQDILINAILKLPSECHGLFEVYFIGRVLEKEYFQLQKKRTERFDNIHWEGEMSRNLALDYIANSDLLICSSRDGTGPLVVYEAMSLGKPVISTPHGAIPEIIIHGENGLIVENENSNQLSKEIARLLLDKKQIEKLGRNALDTYNKNLRREKAFEKINMLFEKIIPLNKPN